MVDAQASHGRCIRPARWSGWHRQGPACGRTAGWRRPGCVETRTVHRTELRLLAWPGPPQARRDRRSTPCGYPLTAPLPSSCQATLPRPKHHGRDRTADPLHHVFLHGHADLIRGQVAHGQRFLNHFADDRLCILHSTGVFILYDHPVIHVGESQPDYGSDPLAWGVAGDARVHRRRQRPRHELGYGDDRDADREDAGHPKEVQIGDTRVHERSIERRQLGTPLAAAGYDRDGFGLFPHAGPPRKPTVLVPYQRGWYAYLSAPFICRVGTGRGRIPIPSTDDCSCPSRILGTWAYYDIRPGGTLKLVSSRRDRTA